MNLSDHPHPSYILICPEREWSHHWDVAAGGDRCRPFQQFSLSWQLYSLICGFQTAGIYLPGVCFVPQQIFSLKWCFCFMLRETVYPSLESGWKWHKYSNSSHKLSSACSFFCFWPSSDRKSTFSTGEDVKLNVGANTSFIQQHDSETQHEVGCKHFSSVNL